MSSWWSNTRSGWAGPIERRKKVADADLQYVKWLEDQSMTIGKTIRLEIASRLRELTAMGKRDA